MPKNSIVTKFCHLTLGGPVIMPHCEDTYTHKFIMCTQSSLAQIRGALHITVACLSVYICVIRHTRAPCWICWMNEMPFGRNTRVVPSNIILNRGPSSPQKGEIWGQNPQFTAMQPITDAREWRLRSTESRTCVVTRTHSTFGDRAFAAAGPGLWNSLLPYLRCWLTIQSVQAVTKDIFVWIVEARHSANYFNCAINKQSYLLTYCTYLLWPCCFLITKSWVDFSHQAKIAFSHIGVVTYHTNQLSIK